MSDLVLETGLEPSGFMVGKVARGLRRALTLHEKIAVGSLLLRDRLAKAWLARRRLRVEELRCHIYRQIRLEEWRAYPLAVARRRMVDGSVREMIAEIRRREGRP